MKSINLRGSFVNAKDSLRQSWRNSSTDLKSFEESAHKSKIDKIIKLAGVFFWSIAYVAIIAVGHQLQYNLIHRVLIAYDLVWEGAKTFFWSDGDTMLQLFVGVFWFGFDLEIWRIFMLYGDASGNYWNEIFEFCVWFAFFSALSYFATRLGQSVCRIWRHTSELISLFIELSILSKSMDREVPYQKTIGWSILIGNVFYLYSVRNQYENCWNFVKYPVRFLMVLIFFVPPIIFSALYVMIAHEVIVIV